MVNKEQIVREILFDLLMDFYDKVQQNKGLSSIKFYKLEDVKNIVNAVEYLKHKYNITL